MKQYYTKDFRELILKDDWLEKFVESGWCWNGCMTKYPIRIRDFLFISLGWMNNSTPEVHAKLRTILNSREIKGANVFHMPEQIGWCRCEPRHSEHCKLVDEFYNVLYQVHDAN